MRLGFWQKLAIFSITATVGLSGLLWFLVHDVIAEETDGARALLVLHGVSAYALLVAVGSLLPLHVRSGWHRHRKIATGLMVTAMMAALAVTALLLYYGGEDMQLPAKWLHLMFGVGCFIAFPVHAFLRVRRPQSVPRHPDHETAAGLTTYP